MELPEHLRRRVVADSRDREAWVAARSRRIGASDAATYAKLESVPSYIRAKLARPFYGNAHTAYGHEREEIILRQVGFEQNTMLFEHETIPAFAATPDGIRLDEHSSDLVLAQAKTVDHHWRTIPRGYLRQVWWEQFVMGARRTLFVWETHVNFEPVAMEPETCWIDYDEDEVTKLVAIASLVIAGLRAGDEFIAEMEAHAHER